MAENKFHVSSSPHFTEGYTTQKIMACVLIALLPEVIAGTVVFGLKALTLVLVSVLGCVLFEWLFQYVTGQKIVIKNLSACVSGVMLALVLPSTTPVWQVLIADAVAMIVAKGIFGGIGSNVFNPALTGRAVLFISFPAAIGATWYDPHLMERITAKLTAKGLSPEQISAMDLPFDGITSATVLSKLNGPESEHIKAHFDYLTYFLGNRAGCIGETSALLILISFLFLLLTRIIDWRAPLTMVGTVAVCTFFAGLTNGNNEAALDVVRALLTGGLLFGAAFMITDYATAPVTGPGRLVFGAGAGLITFLIRRFGGYPEGVMFSILIMNAVAPHLNNLTGRMYGYGKKGNRKPEMAKINMEFDLNSAVERKEAEND